jgi:hypothetical protein
MKKIQHLFGATLALIGGVLALHASPPISISVHFTGSGNGGVDNSQITSLTNSLMDPTGATVESAGAPGFVTTNWNNFDRYGDVTSGIIDYSGADSGVHIQWDSVSAYSSGAYINVGTGSSDSKLMDGFNTIDWGGGPPGAWTSGNVYGSSFSQKCAQYVGGIQTWLAAQGATSYSVVIYVQGWHGWYGTTETYIQAAGGNPSSGSMTVGADVTPHIFSQDNGAFNGTYTQVPTTSTSYANKTGSGDYIVFNGLTNDAILIRTVEPTGDYQAGKIFGFQIVATPPTPITQAPQISPNPAYALSPVTLTEVASSATSMTYQWQTDGGSGGSLTNMPGATSSTLVVTPPDQGTTYTINYDCIVTNTFGPATSQDSTLTVNAASAPIVTTDTNPTNVYAFVGGSVTFNAAFNGTQPITNQWQVNKGSGFTGIGLTATTNQNLVLANIQTSDAGFYQDVGTNVMGGLNSTPTALTVLADPAAPTPSQAYAYDVFTNSPVAYWRMNEAVDPTVATYQAYDASGHNLNATYGFGVTKVGIVGPQSPAIPGFEPGNTAAGFVAATVNGTLVVPPLNLSSANVTITGWIYPTANAPTFGGLLINRYLADAAGLGFGGNTDTNSSSPTFGQAELGYNWNNNSAAYNFHSGLFPPLNTWSFVALTITPTNASLYLCYVSGGSTNVFKSINNTANSLETFASGTTWLGGDPSSVNNIFTGSIDEVAVFNSGFTDSQVLNLYFAAQGGGTPPLISQNPVGITASSSVSTFAGQTVALTAYGVGYPTPNYQWQGGTGGVFHNLANDSHLSGANSSTITIKTTPADAMNYQLVLANAYGSTTSSVAPVSITPIPDNGLWTVNFAIAGANNGASSTPYSGPGVLGGGTFWNALGGQAKNTTSFRDDGVTSSGINFQATNYPGTWYEPNPQSSLTKLLDPYYNTQTEFYFTNLPNGTYTLVVFGMAGTYLDDSRGTAFTVNGVTVNNVFQQDLMFAPGDNSALFTNVVVTNGGLVIDETPIGLQSDSTPNGEPDFNGVQIQAVSLNTVVLSQTYSGGSGGTLTLSWPSGTLVSTTNLVTGPWVPVAGAVSPFQVSATNNATFFRVKIQ